MKNKNCKNGNNTSKIRIYYFKITKQKFYKVLAESALRAVKLCQPLRVPSTGYERWKELQLNFDAREMLEG